MSSTDSFVPEYLTNEALFQLQTSHGLQLEEPLLFFLRATHVPWKILGQPLTQFVADCVQSIPLSERLKGTISPQAYLENRDLIVVCEGAVIEAGAFVAGPAFIGPGAQVRHGAYLRGSVYLGQEALVGHTTECKGSLFLPFAKAAHFNYVGDSVLGFRCNLGAGTKLANLKINHSEVVLRIGAERKSTGLKKMGAILGNRAQTGCNAVTNPGTVMLPDSVLLANQTGLGVIFPG